MTAGELTGLPKHATVKMREYEGKPDFDVVHVEIRFFDGEVTIYLETGTAPGAPAY